MLVLGIESSCDDTASAVLEDGVHLRSNIIASQNEIHSRFGGIVPELAGRSHVGRIHGIVNEALSEADVKLEDIDLIAATSGPGLVGSLLVGLTTAKALAYALDKPLVGINHLEGHLLAIFLQEEVEFPYLALIVSGGHTDIVRVDSVGDYSILGRTRDDAAGEAFDKVAKMMGLGYPGGPIIDKLATDGNDKAHAFPRALLNNGSLDFSFSGVKTSVKNLLTKIEEGGAPKLSQADIAASFQAAIVDALAIKLMQAAKQESVNQVVVTGGVAANSMLRARVKALADEAGIKAGFPKPVYCTDNAAMIACAAWKRYQSGIPVSDPFSLDARANLPI